MSPPPRTSFDKLGAYRAVLQGRLRLKAAPRVSVKAQLLILACLISLADSSGIVPENFAPSVVDLCMWHELDEREVRGALKALAACRLVKPHERPGAVTTWTILFPFEGLLVRSPRTAPVPSPARRSAAPKDPPPTNGQGVDHYAPPTNGQGVSDDPPTYRQGVSGPPPTHGPGVDPIHLPMGGGAPPADRPGVLGASSGSTQGSTERSDLRVGSDLDPLTRVATSAPDPTPPVGSVASQEARDAPARADAAQDPARRATALAFLPSADENGWKIWEILIRSEALREAEDADASVEPGSLARQASGISGKLIASGAVVEMGTKAAQDLARELEADRAAAGNRWSRPNMQRVSSLLARYFASNLRLRGVHPTSTTARGPGGASRVPNESGAYNETAARAGTKARLRAAAEEGGAK